jgi:hypothetical protein
MSGVTGRLIFASYCLRVVSVRLFAAVAGAASLLVAALSGCTSESNQSASGDALTAVGPQAQGSFGFDSPRAGGTYYLGFPGLKNTSSRPVHVRDFRFDSTSSNVRLLGYVVYSTRQFGGRLLSIYDAQRPIPGLDLRTIEPLDSTYTIRPHQRSNRFAMAKVKLIAYPPNGFARGCVVSYTVGSSTREYDQQFPCDFYLGSDITPGSGPRITIVNSTTHKIRIFGCPECGPAGLSIPGAPAPPGGGPVDSWAVREGVPLTYRVLTNGDQITCQPPTSLGSAEDLTGELAYDITKDGRCIVLK